MSETTTAPERRSRLWTALAILALRDKPFWGESWLRRLLRLPVAGVYIITMISLLLLPFENRLAFPGWAFAREWNPPDKRLNVEEVSLTSADGNTIHAWFTAPKDWRPEQGAILYSHGNGHNLSAWQHTMLLYRERFGRAILIYDYPGFGKSTGKPTEKGCYQAIDAAYAWLVEQKKVPANEIILMGSSLGGAFATDLATRAECRMLLLVNTFTSFPDMAQTRFFFLPARWLVSNKMDSINKIGSVKAPVFFTAGRADTVVPFHMSERLYQSANEPKRFYPLDNHPHHDPDRPEFFDAVHKFLYETRSEARGR